MQITNLKDVKKEIENQYELAFPCIKYALDSENSHKEIIAVQHRLLTHKEVLLHRNMLEDKELKQTFSALKQNEKGIALGGIRSINQTIAEIDEIIERYCIKMPTRSYNG
ncbi:hypothetical protein L1D16_12690 [Vibrio sp. Isolate31]|uniref:hypothetical protein n=1 Tax=unclassified Vibrio TaxID=2614977 RepID=UPI001EFD513B|nr:MULTISPECIES: hypothetical protein [unclassified Vibrio]MCG9553608.1 hypothetical protein [Vibrio sp. Isolate32]MCG9601717.1 hypothetical protein [Vibrio sp. Isolate31]